MPTTPSFTGETGEAPSFRTYRARHAAEGAAGTDFDECLCTADIQGNVSAVRFIPDAAMSGINTTSLTYLVRNKTATLVPASLQFVLNTDLVAFTAKALTLGAAAQLVVNVGDVLSFAKTHLSTGAQGVAGTIEVDVTRSDVV